jgi:hypothetical protein
VETSLEMGWRMSVRIGGNGSGPSMYMFDGGLKYPLTRYIDHLPQWHDFSR